MYLSDLRVYFKVTRSKMEEKKMAEKLVDYANTTNVELLLTRKFYSMVD